MKKAILLHGLADKEEYYDKKTPSNSNSHWFPWLQKQLMIHDIKADTPEVPNTFEFNWSSWVKEVERFEIDTNTTLVGHSMGGGFWVRYLSEHPEISVDKVVLVAPWLNLRHEEKTNFFDFEIDPAIVEHTNNFIMFSSDNDHPDVQNSVNLLEEKLPNITFKSFHNYGHFCYRDLKTDEFPELLDTILF
jgi:predicted alpha/beta hydrolase family esterase